MKLSSVVLAGMFALVSVTAHAQARGDAAAGAKVYKRCMACHSLEAGKNRVGPSLNGVFGRKAGLAPGFKYSENYVKGIVSWDAKTLDAYLADPKKVMGPKSRMAFRLANPKDRADVIAFLATRPTANPK
jgi:cytochrome c